MQRTSCGTQQKEENKINGLTIAGRKKDDGLDFYETPTWAAETAVERMIVDGILGGTDICEPCCGAGAIVNVLKAHGFDVRASDIQTADFIAGGRGVDVYDLPSNSADIIFTNPPYNLMTRGAMLDEFLRISRQKVILLLNIFFLSSKARRELLERSPLEYVYIHSDRVTMYPHGEEPPKNGGTKMFAWFVWNKGYHGEPKIRWL